MKATLATTPPSGDRQHVPTDQAAPERIWLDLPSFNGAVGFAHPEHHRTDGWPEYIRADLAAPSAPAEVIDAHAVAEAMEGQAGIWRTCTGCYETCDGQPFGNYPYSAALRCDLGGGCRECGGIGAIWDTTDYADMGDWLARGGGTSAPAEVEGLVGRLRDEHLAMTREEAATALTALQAENKRLTNHAEVRRLTDLLDGATANLEDATARAEKAERERDELRTDAQFLVDRLAGVDGYSLVEDDARDWYGHVSPAITRLGASLAAHAKLKGEM
ncbi:hypothetical protein [Paracoccus cavernae]|uniref:hypothetical protein n=1 Tax=Paracoccus cavernae TaxID=1571207 RepID=UPI0035F42AF6